MNKTRLIFALGCASVVSLHARSHRGPFAEMRKMLDAFDQVFEEHEKLLDETHKKRAAITVSHSETDDLFEVQFQNIDTADFKADLDGNTLRIKTPQLSINIVAHPGWVALSTSQHAISESKKDENSETHQNYSRQESWSESSTTLSVKGKLKLADIANDSKNIEFNTKEKTLTIRIPKEKTSQSIPVSIVDNEDAKEKETQEREKQKPKLIKVEKEHSEEK